MSGNAPTVKELFKTGAHVGHLRSKTDARTHKFVYVFKNRIAVIDLDQTERQIQEMLKYLNAKAKEGALILFSGTKMQAKDKIKEIATQLKMPYVNQRWPGGLITNFSVVSKSIKKMVKTEKDLAENKFEHLTKNERLQIEKNLEKSKMIFDGLRDLERIPDVLFIVDAKEEDIAILEAKAKGIPVVALCDTNTNPNKIDYPIIINDDSKKSIDLVLDIIAEEIAKNYKARTVENVGDKVDERVEKALSEIKKEKSKAVKKKAVKK